MNTNTPDFIVIIPARLKSTRLPEKLLQPIGDKTVLAHTYQQTQKSQARAVYLAVDDAKLAEQAATFGAHIIMTQAADSGTARLAEAVRILDLPDDTLIVNVQGDEPFMPAELIDLCAKTLAAKPHPMATLATPIHDAASLQNPNVVKVVCNQQGDALYFSRAPIPFNRDNQSVDLAKVYFHHLGIYAYRAGFLKRFLQLPESQLANLESLEQLRVLDAGESIAVAITSITPPKGIDSAEDLAAARAYFSATDSGENS